MLLQTLRRLTVALALSFGTSPALAVDSVFIQSQLDYNAILISGVDIVFIYDEQVLDEFPNSKSAWYSGKVEFIEQAGERADVVSIFIPQGFDSEMASLPERRDQALKVFIYGQHDASNASPVDVTAMDDVLVQIDQFGILVSSRN
ncbi:MAG: hypothetical protein MRY76_08570 [Pseudomonadales bacterium]|nr:hypothetical protein [Pseudomonadales bacterium]